MLIAPCMHVYVVCMTASIVHMCLELVLSYIKSGSIYQFRNIYRGHIYFLWYIYSLVIFWFYRVYLVDYQN